MTISSLTEARRNDPACQVFTLLRIGFTVAPIPGPRSHLEGCPACREEHESLLALVSDEN